jgi:hypothetical protein
MRMVNSLLLCTVGLFVFSCLKPTGETQDQKPGAAQSTPDPKEGPQNGESNPVPENGETGDKKDENTSTVSCSAPYGTSGVSFFGEVKTKMDALCGKCHGEAQQGNYETSYTGTAVNIEKVIKVLTDQAMPPATETFDSADRDALLQQLKDWAGANCPR